MTGPTTTGSIDAKLTLDDSDFKRGMAEAKAEAREVAALNPTVKIDANVGPALAKMAEVQAVERQLADTNVRLAATQKIVDREQVNSTRSALRLATVEKMLGESRKAETTETAKSTVTENEHSVAVDKSSIATDKLSSAKRALQIAEANFDKVSKDAKATLQQRLQAENALATATRNLAAEQDKANESTNRATQANNQRVSGLQVLMGLSPAILAAAAPIAASAVGLGVAFGVAGVSGVLALKGIKDAMVVGDGVGNQYAAGIGVLKGSLDTLSATSANAMLGSFNGFVGDINAHMPFLNQLVREGSGLLGQMGGTALSGVLNGLEKMNPLIQTGGVELGKFVTWLFSFTSSNGFSEFIAYAQANLPATMHLIESLVTTAGHIVAAFAPLGPVVIGVLTGISDAASSLPLPVLAGLVTAATAAGPAFRIAGAGVALFGICLLYTSPSPRD